MGALPGGRVRRNLYYFVCPMGEWRWNVLRLRSFWPVFNGRRLVYAASGPQLEGLEAVREAFDGSGAEVVATPNSPQLGETASFLKGLESFLPPADDEVTFYGHAKGVSHPPGPALERIKRWADAMYVLNLSSPELVDKVMARHHSAGCFVRKQPFAGSHWHFSGTFFWFRNSALFSRDWRKIDPTRHGVEGYIGTHFAAEEAFEFTPFGRHPHLYEDPPAEEAYKGWLADLVRTHLHAG